MKDAQLQHVSSSIATHYGLRWEDKTLALRQLGPAHVFSNLFFVSIWVDKQEGTHLYLVDHSAITVEDEGLRCKIPAFHFSPQMLSQVTQDKYQVWYVSMGDELVRIKNRDFAKLSKQLRIKTGDDSRHRFDQIALGSDIQVRQDYLPRRGKVKKNSWATHLKSVRRTLPELS